MSIDKPFISYDVRSEPSPEYLAGQLYGRLGIYHVVKFVDHVEVEVLETFDWEDSAASRKAAYDTVKKLMEKKNKR